MGPPDAQTRPAGGSGPAAESLAGMVERVTFHSDESGFTVLRVKARGHRELVAVVGTAPEISPGEWVEAEGSWRMDPQHGRQFQAARLTVTAPDTLEGIEKYLGSGLIKGVGPHYAARLVQAFGREVFDVIEKRSALLLKVEGIGRVRRERIRAAWAEQRAVREIMTFLFSHGVSTSRAFRIYKVYGERAIERVRMDPYCLARDIHGIGFLSADRIAGRLGIAKDSDLRARAGVEYALLELTQEGHCAYPRDRLAGETAQRLDIEPARALAAIERGVKEGLLVQHPGPGGEPWIYLPALDFAERELARHLGDLSAGAAPLAGVDAVRAAEWAERKMGIDFDPVQREAVRQSLGAKVLVLTGGPGVGKTTLVQAIVRIHRAKDLKVVLCAPTGRAAKRLSEATGAPAATIHRLLAFDPSTGDFRYNARLRLEGSLFVVDEASMLDVPLAYQLVRAIPTHASLLLVGDIDQLPSVGPGRVLRDVIDSGVVPVCRLTHVFRQAAQSRIITTAHGINEGRMPEFDEGGSGAPSDFYFVSGEDPDAAVGKLIRLIRESIPRTFRLDPFDDVQVLTPMQRGTLGARNLNAVLQEALNPSGAAVERFGVRFRLGDKVMQTENDYDKDVFNGDIGRIVGIVEEERELTVDFDGRRVAYDFQELDELVPSYAITIHKSQGSEYPCVVVPIHTQHYIMLQRNLLYTAVTRGRKLVILLGTKKAVAIAVQRAEARERFTSLKQRLVEAARHPSTPGLPFDARRPSRHLPPAAGGPRDDTEEVRP